MWQLQKGEEERIRVDRPIDVQVVLETHMTETGEQSRRVEWNLIVLEKAMKSISTLIAILSSLENDCSRHTQFPLAFILPIGDSDESRRR
jgi:hypothetical protein